MLTRSVKNTLLILLFSLFVQSSLFSQVRLASPYSRYGIGDMSENNNSWNLALGGTSIALKSTSHVNYMNPASYIAFDSSSFLFEGGFNIDMVTLTSNLQTANRNFASVGYLLFGIPITKWWHSSIGLIPYSKIGYNIASFSKVDQTNVARIYNGSGGISRFYIGNAFKPVKNLSIGFNFSYLFGSMDRASTVLFPDSVYYTNYKLDNSIVINDIFFDFGIQYTLKIKNDLKMTFGAIYSPETKISAKTDLLARTFRLGGGGTEVYKDTIAIATGYKGNIVIPTMFGAGVSIEKTDNWLVGADYRWQNWSKFSAFNLSDSLVNSFSLSAGVEYLPDVGSYSNFLKRVRYRFGFLYHSTYLELYGKHLNEYAFSLGFGMPIKGKTALTLSAQVGSRGTTELNLIRETYFRFTIGFSIYERMFVKRKYF
ncbi:MAG: hypothetical protein WCL00_10395 [Bacteroidota bacterium]